MNKLFTVRIVYNLHETCTFTCMRALSPSEKYESAQHASCSTSASVHPCKICARVGSAGLTRCKGGWGLPRQKLESAQVVLRSMDADTGCRMFLRSGMSAYNHVQAHARKARIKAVLYMPADQKIHLHRVRAPSHAAWGSHQQCSPGTKRTALAHRHLERARAARGTGWLHTPPQSVSKLIAKYFEDVCDNLRKSRSNLRMFCRSYVGEGPGSLELDV